LFDTDVEINRSKLAALGAERLADVLLDLCGDDSELLQRLASVTEADFAPAKTPARDARNDASKSGTSKSGDSNDARKPRTKTTSVLPESDGDTPELPLDEPHMVGTSGCMRSVFETIRRFGSTDAPVLITGESGTGKEMAALALHERSPYAAGPFVAINCAGMPADLIASELFGHEKGSFTGAYQRKIGRIEAAKGGTVFLDEIGDLPLDLQPHLLRFLQEKTIDRVGGNRAIPVDVRVIAATNADLEKAMSEGRFREDLFYRLNVLSLELPPLREREQDIDLLAKFFLKKFAREMNRPAPQLAASALRALRQHSWPGNVRELISCVRRAVVVSDSPEIMAHELGLPGGRAFPVVQPEERDADAAAAGSAGAGAPGQSEFDIEADVAPAAAAAGDATSAAGTDPADGDAPSLLDARRRMEGELVRDALQSHHYNVTRTAAALGVSRVTLYRLMKEHGIRPARAARS